MRMQVNDVIPIERENGINLYRQKSFCLFLLAIRQSQTGRLEWQIE